MPVTAPSNANKRRANPNGLQTGNPGSSVNLPDVYTGSMDEMAPTANALKQKANDIVSLLRNKSMKDVENSKKMEIMKNSFPGFLYRGYQDVIDGLTRQKILANEHYNKTITFEIKPYNYYSLDSAEIILQLKAETKKDSGIVMDSSMTTADCFFGRYFTNIKVKKLGDVNVINPNSDDVIEQYQLFLKTCNQDYLRYDENLLTSPMWDDIPKSKRTKESNTAIDYRITNFRDKIIQPEGGRYHVPLKLLVNLSYIRSLPPETSLQIEITINQNGKELFETKKDAAGNDPDPGYINITKVPELHIETIDQTSTHQLNFETIFNEQGQYRLWHGMSWNTMQTEIATGKSEIRLQFSPDTRQYSHLKLSIRDLNTIRHPNLWCSYDHDEILTLFKTIKIEGLFGNNTRDALYFDKNEPDDCDTIYRNYLARENGFTYSDANSVDYKNSIMIKYMKKRSKFFTSNNSIMLDISKSKGYTGRDDPPNNVINPDITLKFQTATTKNYIFTVTAYFDSSYILTTNGAAGATDKIIEYCPTLEPIKNGL